MSTGNDRVAQRPGAHTGRRGSPLQAAFRIGARCTRASMLAGVMLLASPATAAPPASRAGLLVDQTGAAMPPSRLAGRVLLVYFGYTHCPDLCPAALTTIAATLRELGPAGDAVLPVFVTVDPARDTVAVLRDYARHFHPRLLALTGSPAAIADAARSFNVQFKPAGADARGGYAVDHSVLIYLADRDGSVLRGFHPNHGARELAAAIRPLLGVPGAQR